MTTLDARSRGVEARLRGLKWMVNCEMRGLVEDATGHEAANMIAEQRAEIERLNAAMVLVPRMTLGPQGKR